MFLTNIFRLKKTCNHEKISPDQEMGYCPDCGKLIKNEWYITRCACCGVKLRSCSKNGKIVPQNHFCSNCGANEYIVEKLDKISFINIDFAVLQKKIETSEAPYHTIQCQVEKTYEQPKLIVKYL